MRVGRPDSFERAPQLAPVLGEWEASGHTAVMIERDDKFPPFAELLAELDHARRIATGVSAAKTGAAA